ncbi:MAG: hypothetical protein ACK4VV_05410 [Pseudomonas sp.]
MNTTKDKAAWFQGLSAQRQHNAKLVKRINLAQYRLQEASSPEDVLLVVRLFLDFESPVAFKKTNAYLSIALGVAMFLGMVGQALFGILGLFGWLHGFIAAVEAPVKTLLMLAGIAIVFINFERLKKRKKAIETLSDSLKTKYAYFTLGLTLTPVRDDFTLMAKHFSEFRRRMTHQWTQRKVMGHYQGDTHAFPFTYYQYKFVVRESRQGRKHDVDVIYTRCALVVDFPWISDVIVEEQVRRKGGFRYTYQLLGPTREDDSNAHLIKWYQEFETASSAFNNRFKVRGKSKVHCARFVKPITLVSLLDISHLREMNIELADQRMCLSFDSPNGLVFTSNASLHNPQALLKEMQQGYSMPGLDRTLALIHTLATQHDNNFESINAAAPA